MRIQVDGLGFSYGRQRVLGGISFAADEGQLIAVLGPNGVGKSTLFRCLLGLLHGYEGRIAVEGDDIRTLSAREMAHRIAYIPQSNYPSFNYTVMEMVLMGTTHQVKGLSSPRASEIKLAEDAMEQIGITHLRSRGYGQLSGGERQMVLIARALAQQARILVMDEPTSNLDYGNQLRVMHRVNSLARQGYVILLSSHNPQQALLFADRVIAMSAGGIVADGMPAEVCDEALLERLYGVKVRLAETPDGKFVIPLLKGEV